MPLFQECTDRLLSIAQNEKDKIHLGESPTELAQNTIKAAIARQISDTYNFIVRDPTVSTLFLTEITRDPIIGTEVPVIKEQEIKPGHIIPIPPYWKFDSFSRADAQGIPNLIQQIRLAIGDTEVLRNLLDENKEPLNLLGYAIVPKKSGLLIDTIKRVESYALENVFPGEDYNKMVENFAEELQSKRD